VDLERFSRIDRRGHDRSAPVVVMLGRLIRQKGIPEFAAVAQRVRQEWPHARFLLAGEEEHVHPDAVASEWLHAQESIEFLGRLSDVRPMLEVADLLLFPSYYREGVPRVVMEAAATGLPTVAFDVPGVREAVRDGESGYLVPDRDVAALTACVFALLEDEEHRLAMGAAARRLAEEAFDIRSIHAQYLEVYRELGFEV
jgi:glycosyltransferase involved in cell wall biosynthesis